MTPDEALMHEALAREGCCYCYASAFVKASAAETLSAWREAEAAEMSVRPWLNAACTRIVWALTLVDVERLVVPIDGCSGTLLRYLVENGIRMQWSADAIRRAREDSPDGERTP